MSSSKSMSSLGDVYVTTDFILNSLPHFPNVHKKLSRTCIDLNWKWRRRCISWRPMQHHKTKQQAWSAVFSSGSTMIYTYIYIHICTVVTVILRYIYIFMLDLLCQVTLSKGLILTQKATRLQIVFRVIEMYSFCNICALHKEKHLQLFSQDEVKRTKHLALASSCFQRPLSCWNNSELNVVQNIHPKYNSCGLLVDIFNL